MFFSKLKKIKINLALNNLPLLVFTEAYPKMMANKKKRVAILFWIAPPNADTQGSKPPAFLPGPFKCRNGHI